MLGKETPQVQISQTSLTGSPHSLELQGYLLWFNITFSFPVNNALLTM